MAPHDLGKSGEHDGCEPAGSCKAESGTCVKESSSDAVYARAAAAHKVFTTEQCLRSVAVDCEKPQSVAHVDGMAMDELGMASAMQGVLPEAENAFGRASGLTQAPSAAVERSAAIEQQIALDALFAAQVAEEAGARLH